MRSALGSVLLFSTELRTGEGDCAATFSAARKSARTERGLTACQTPCCFFGLRLCPCCRPCSFRRSSLGYPGSDCHSALPGPALDRFALRPAVGWAVAAVWGTRGQPSRLLVCRR